MKSYTTQRIVYAKSAAAGKSVFDERNVEAINEIAEIVYELKELCI